MLCVLLAQKKKKKKILFVVCFSTDLFEYIYVYQKAKQPQFSAPRQLERPGNKLSCCVWIIDCIYIAQNLWMDWFHYTLCVQGHSHKHTLYLSLYLSLFLCVCQAPLYFVIPKHLF